MEWPQSKGFFYFILAHCAYVYCIYIRYDIVILTKFALNTFTYVRVSLQNTRTEIREVSLGFLLLGLKKIRFRYTNSKISHTIGGNLSDVCILSYSVIQATAPLF